MASRSTVKSRSRMGAPRSMSRMAPPVSQTFMPASVACAAWPRRFRLATVEMAFEHEQVVAHVRPWGGAGPVCRAGGSGPHGYKFRLWKVGVAEHCLQTAKVGAAFEKMRRKCMTHDMGRKVVKDAGLLPVELDRSPEGLPRHGAAAGGDEEVRRSFALQQLHPAPSMYSWIAASAWRVPARCAACCPCR